MYGTDTEILNICYALAEEGGKGVVHATLVSDIQSN